MKNKTVYFYLARPARIKWYAWPVFLVRLNFYDVRVPYCVLYLCVCVCVCVCLGTCSGVHTGRYITAVCDTAMYVDMGMQNELPTADRDQSRLENNYYRLNNT
jgi:hypothetical protein